LAVRYPGKLIVRGETMTDRCSLEPGMRVVTEHVTLTLEASS
jgi:hypothetical protein